MSGGFLIVRRSGALWGLNADQVATIERRDAAAREGGGGALEVRFAGGRRLAVDAVVILAAELAVRPLSARLRHFLPAGAAGLALLAGEPLVLLARDNEVLHV